MRRRGSALVGAIWILAVLSILIASYAVDAQLQTGINLYLRERVHVDHLTDAGIAVAEVILTDYQNVSVPMEGTGGNSASAESDIEEKLEDDRWYLEKVALKDNRECDTGAIPVDALDRDGGTVTVKIKPIESKWNINRLYAGGDANYDKLWEAILFTSRVTDDPEKAWADHDKDLQARCDYLNSLGIRSLHYTADNGTDFTVGLIPEGRFCGGGETARTGIFFNPNIPTEECFVSPMKGQAEGIVYATKPLSYRGQLIEGFSIRFAGGKAVEVHAEKGEDLLKAMISMDEGAAYLGECALVPQASPIAESGLLFYNTLFDENAACHLALGMGFPDTIADFQNKTLEECRSLGINDSMIHEDFMIGCDSMTIDALCADGSTKPIFRNGNWAF